MVHSAPLHIGQNIGQMATHTQRWPEGRSALSTSAICEAQRGRPRDSDPDPVPQRWCTHAQQDRACAPAARSCSSRGVWPSRVLQGQPSCAQNGTARVPRKGIAGSDMSARRVAKRPSPYRSCFFRSTVASGRTAPSSLCSVPSLGLTGASSASGERLPVDRHRWTKGQAAQFASDGLRRL